MAQTAYQIQIATRPELLSATPDVWDSGRVESAQSVGVKYAGPALTASTRYYWRVQAWDRDGVAYPASEASWWEAGLMDPEALRGVARTLCAPFELAAWRAALEPHLGATESRIQGRAHAEPFSGPRLAEHVAAAWRTALRDAG